MSPADLTEGAQPPVGRRLAGLALGLGLIGVLAAIDVHFSLSEIVIGIVVVGPFATALLAGVRETALVAAVAILVAALSVLWNHNFGTGAYFIRLGGVCVGSVFGMAGARALTGNTLGQRRLELLAAVASVSEGRPSPEETVRRLADLLVPDMADLVAVDVLRDGRQVRLATRWTGADRERVEARIRSRVVDASPAREVLERGEPVLYETVGDALLARMAADPEDLELLRGLRPLSGIVVPLRAREQTFGVVVLATAEHSGRRYVAGDLRFARVLSGRLALALDNAGLFSELETVEAQLSAALGSLSDAVTVQDRSGRLVYANQQAARSMGYESPDALLATPSAQVVGRYDMFDEAGAPIDPTRLPGRRLLGGEPVAPVVMRTVERASGEERWMLVKASPVMGRDGGVAMAVNVMEDITDVKRAELGQRLLVQAGEVLSSSLDFEQTLQRVAELAVPELADWCGVSLPEPDGMLRSVAIAHVDPAKVRFARELSRRYPASMDDPTGGAEVIRTGASQLVTDIPDELLEQAIHDAEQLELIRSIGMRSVIIVPLAAAGGTIGALTLVNAESGRTFTETDLGLAEELGRRAGTAVHNARLYSERTHIARTLQTGLLPEAMPQIPGVAVATLYRPAGEENWVGGDFYDAFGVGDAWMIVVGDVAGRGPEAAALTALARYTLRTAATISGDPLQAMRHLNQQLLARPVTSLVTLACAIVDRAPAGLGRCRLLTAGHPPGLLVRDGEVRLLGRFGPMLGAFEHEAWEAESVDVRDGDLLVLYTDGVIDTRGAAGARFGEERLHEAVASARDAEEVVRRIDRALQGFEEGEQADDTAVVALRFGAMAGTARSAELQGGSTAPRRARGAIAEWFGGALREEVLADVRILVSELVTNAVRHAGASDAQTVGLDARLRPGGTLRVAVTDAGPGFRPASPPRPHPDGGGQGLVLLNSIADRWGVDGAPGRTVVWFEIDGGAAGDGASAAAGSPAAGALPAG